jgi:sterol desaturase/sphingolipid hydroxylase (fatty acid hydroxylase superfamily)
MNLLLACTVATLALNGITIQVLERAYHGQKYAANHFRAPLPVRASAAEKRRLFALNSALSLALLFGAIFLFFPRLFTDGAVEPGRVVLEAGGVLLLYDLLYYGLHRFVFHHKKLIRYVHALHHAARTPSAEESLYTHPVELVSGLLLFLACTAAIGPVHVLSFSLANLVYSELNIFIHSGIDFPAGPLRLMNPLARAHHGHHGVDMNKNFASLSPIWDRLLGTSV